MNVGVLLFHRVGDLDAVGPIAVLNAARALSEMAELDITTVARSRFSIQTAADLTLTPRWAFASAPQYDVLLVPGGPGIEAAMKDRAVEGFLAKQRPHLEVLAGISSGALLLGTFGYLRNQKATTHPDVLQHLEDYEVLRTCPDRVVKNPTGIWCAAGISAGMELALELLTDRFGLELSRRVARHLGFPC